MLTKNGKKRYKKFQDSDDVADKRQKKESDESSGTTSTESEVFRTDLIKSMRTDIALAGGCAELIPIQDKWKEEWNHGVQVCVNESVEPAVPVEKVYWPYPEDYVFPGKNILCHPTSSCLDESKCIQSPVPKRMYYSGGADDQHWLELINDMRQPKKLPRITLEMLYDVLNALEFYCYQNTHFELLQPVQRNEEEDAVCDICRSADSYAEDEIVFCDGCNLSVHQICYGLLSIPTHDWLCTCCALRYGKKTPCVLCPNLGGAMKCTADGALWAHVSCALWMPEVKFGDIDHREPICGISDIRRERLQLRCSICDLREGACIQCTIDKCKTAFHVVCGHRANLILKMEDDDIDEVKKTALCLKHTKAAELSSEDNLAEPVASTSAASDNTVLKEIEKYFPLYVNIEKITQELQLDPDVVKDIYALWLCKRKENNHRPIIKEPVGIDLAENLRAISNPSTLDEKIDRIIAQRGNMERARNLCYQIGQREKKKRSLVHSRVDIFEKTMEMMTKPTIPVNMRVLTKMKIFKNSNVVETKPIETKPIETKPIETKPIETKPIETKTIETKTIETKTSSINTNNNNQISGVEDTPPVNRRKRRPVASLSPAMLPNNEEPSWKKRLRHSTSACIVGDLSYQISGVEDIPPVNRKKQRRSVACLSPAMLPNNEEPSWKKRLRHSTSACIVGDLSPKSKKRNRFHSVIPCPSTEGRRVLRPKPIN